MKKFALCLGIVSMVAFVTLGDMNSALANVSEPDLPQIASGTVDSSEGLVFGQNGNDCENGHEGDPNSLGDGLDFSGDGLIGGFDGVNGDGCLTLVEWMRMVLEQLIPNP